MKWPWRTRAPEPVKPPGTCEGAKAHEEATANLAEATAHWPEVKRVSQSLRELRERNHFAQQIQYVFRGEKP